MLEQSQPMLLSSLFPARAGWAEVAALGHVNVSLVAVLRPGGRAEDGVCPRFLMENIFLKVALEMKAVFLTEVCVAGLRKKCENISLRDEHLTPQRLINFVFLANQINF